MSVVTTIPKEKAKAFVRKLTETLSGNHDVSKVDMVDRLNRQLAGWAAFHKFTDFTARTFRRIDHVVFWKLAYWLARKYRSRIKPPMRNWYRAPEAGKAKPGLSTDEAIGETLSARHCAGCYPALRRGSGGEIRRSIHTSRGANCGARSPHDIMMWPWPWARLEWRTVCAERRPYGSGRRSALRFLLHSPLGRASSMSPSSSMLLHDALSAGE